MTGSGAGGAGGGGPGRPPAGLAGPRPGPPSLGADGLTGGPAEPEDGADPSVAGLPGSGLPQVRILREVGTFIDRHGPVTAEPGGACWCCAARTARSPSATRHSRRWPPRTGGPAARSVIAARLAEHAAAGRTVGVLLVRLGGYAAGVFTGAPPRLADSKVGSRRWGRTPRPLGAARGQSQQQFTQRRENAGRRRALGAAADHGGRADVRALWAGPLDALVRAPAGTGARWPGCSDDSAAAPGTSPSRSDRFLTTPDPRLAVLRTGPQDVPCDPRPADRARGPGLSAGALTGPVPDRGSSGRVASPWSASAVRAAPRAHVPRGR